MAAEVHSDLTLIQDEDVLRRMWADTEDFGRKKEIRARMYKLREQRLKDFYTAGDVSQVTRKHATTRHTESIGDQGFLSMKTKEIRDSESPTRDFNRAIITTTNDNPGYWNSRQENSNVTQHLEGGGLLKETLDTTEGRGVIRGADCETELALGSENRHTRVSKNDKNSSYEAEALNQSSKMDSVTKTDNGTVSTAKSENYNESKSHEESKSSDHQSSTKKWSSSSQSVSSSSKKIVSSSSYHVSSDGQNVQAITYDDNFGASPDILLSQTEDALKRVDSDVVDRSERSESRIKSSVNRSEQSKSATTSQREERISEKVESAKQQEISQKYTDLHDDSVDQRTSTRITTVENQRNRLESSPKVTSVTLVDKDDKQTREADITQTTKRTEAREINNQFSKTESVKSETESLTNQKIMSEIQKLDSYLSTHTPAASTPVSPHGTTDVNNWTIVSKDNRDNEFTYEPRTVSQEPDKSQLSPRSQEKVDKNLSNIDLPKEATEGQYVTTYQSHYTRPDRISVDNSPSHDYFASTLRSSPDRQTPSPSKKTASRNSLDRSSPERKWRQSPRCTTSPSTERATPESRPQSRPADRKSPDRKQRTSTAKTPDREAARRSPIKSPDRERKRSTGSYTIERPKSETRRKSEVRADTKPKRKFSSTQQKQVTKARASTPGSSPTRKNKDKDSSDTDSDNSQATYNKSKSDIRVVTDSCETISKDSLSRRKENNLPKEESSEYFSEGSVTNEFTKKRHESSPERSAFTPIKNFRTNPESGTFIVGEKKQIIQESEVPNEQYNGKDDFKEIDIDKTDQFADFRTPIPKHDTSAQHQNPRSSSPSPERSGRASPEKPSTKSSVLKSTSNVDSDQTLVSKKEKVTSTKISETRNTSGRSTENEPQLKKVTKISEVQRKKDSDFHKNARPSSDRSSSISPERKVSQQERKVSPERKVPLQQERRVSPERKVPKGMRGSPDRNSQSPVDQKPSNRGPQKSPSVSPVRKSKSPNDTGIKDRSPGRDSKSPSLSPERITHKRSSPERKQRAQSPVKKINEMSTTKSEERRTTSITRQNVQRNVTRPQDSQIPSKATPRRSSIPRSEKRLTPKNSRDHMQIKPTNTPSPTKPVPSAQRPTSTTQKLSPRSPQKSSPVISQKSPESIQKRVTKSSPTSTTLSSRTTVKTTTVQVVKTQEKPKQITQSVTKPSSIGSPRKSPQVNNKKPASPATTPKGPSTNSRTVTTKTSTVRTSTIPSRVQPLRNKEPEKKREPQIRDQGRTKTRTTTTTKTQNQLKSRQFIEDECECLDHASDLEDVAPPDYFDVEIDEEEEPKKQFEEIDANLIIKSRKIQQKNSQDRQRNDKKLKKRDVKRNSGSSSSEDETDLAPTKVVPVGSKGFLTADSTQDYLNVTVQHPKSSRESSPGYTSERIPVSTTSDDGESNPRYADYISEPEDVEIFDTLRGPRGPIPLREIQTTDLDEVDISRTSVADKVSVFLEAAKNSLEPQESHQTVEIDGSHSVRSAKNLFENISKTQASTVQTSKTDIYDNKGETLKTILENRPSAVTPSSASPSVNEPLFTKPIEKLPDTDVVDEVPSIKTHAYQERAAANEPEFVRKRAYETQETAIKKESTDFKTHEIEDGRKTVRKDTPVPEPLEATMNKPTKKPFVRNISASNVDVNSKRNFFERKVQQNGKQPKEQIEEVRPVTKDTPRKRSTGNSETFMKSTVASSVRAQSPEKVQKPVERRRTSDDLVENRRLSQPEEQVTKPSQVRESSPSRRPWRQEDTISKQENVHITERKTSSDISSVRSIRRQSPSKETGPKLSPKDKPLEATKSFDEDDDLRSPLKVRDSNTIIKTDESDELTKSTGKFGVTLRKTPSNTKIVPTPAAPSPKKASATGDSLVIEEIFDLEILEKMLIKAVAYEERRRIRAQIRLVKTKLEEEHNRSGIRPGSATPTKTRNWTPKEKSPERISNYVTSRKIEETTKFKGEERWAPGSRRSPERKPSTDYKQTTYKEVVTTTQTRETPERRLTTQKSRESPERRLPKQRSRESPEKTVRQSSRTSPERKVPSQVEKRSQIKSDAREINQVTTYQATVKTQTTRNVTSDVKEASATDSIISSYGVGPTDDDGKPLFGLRALRRTNTNKALTGESEEQEDLLIEAEQTRKDSATEDILDSLGRPLFGGLKALQTDTMPAPTSQLKELVERNQLLVQGSSVMESSKTVVTSHSSVSSDGKVSHRRDVVKGELTSKNGEQPVGKITQSSYSYQKGNEKGSTPQVTSKTVTSVIGGRRNSGPRIEEITDGSQSASCSRRYSKEYTVEEDCSVSSDRRRSSTGLNEDNVRAFTSILRNKDASVRKSSLETEESELRTSKTSSNDETTKRTLTRGDSIKALTHKYQQATEAANQPTSRSYPKAGLILRSNSLHGADDQNQLSSSMKHVSTVQSSKTTDLDGAVVTSTQTKTSEDTRTVRTAGANPGASQTTSTRTEVKSTGATSFLDNSSKVTGVQDILTRMRNADLVNESGDSTEDAEARALLNKFLGASVILQGMEQGMKAATTQSSTALVNQADKQWVKATSQRTQDDIDDIYDEKQLQILLDACSDYDERRKIRARLREVMAEKKGGSSTVAGEGGSGLVAEDTSESAGVVPKSGQSFSKTEAQTRIVSSPAKLTKANSIQSPFAKFKQLERQNSAPSVSRAGSFTLPTSASSIKERLLEWVQAQTRDYKNVQIDNFSTSWSDGLAFCALIHHFCPDAFDYSTLTPKNQRYNFHLAFTVAEEKADIYPLLDVEDMVMMSRPDWKCVFTYVQSIYRRFHDSPLSNATNPYL